MKFSESIRVTDLIQTLSIIEESGVKANINTSIFIEPITNHMVKLFDAIDGLNRLTRIEVLELGLGINDEREKEITDLKEEIKLMADLYSRLKKIELIMKKQ